MAWYNFSNRPQRDLPTYNPISEDEDKLLEEPIQPPNRELVELQRANTNLKRILGLCVTLFLTLFAIIAFKAQHLHKTNLLIPQILKTPVPPMPMNVQTFIRDPVYASPPSPESNEAWNNLLPPGRGFVFVPDSQSYNLPPGELTPEGEIYSVSLFHQLHCLGQLRKYYWMLLNGVKNNEPTLMPMVDLLLGPQGEHVSHCFDYLRQGLQCAGDMSMEWPRVEEDGRRFAVDGWGIPHECKSWDGIVEYMKGVYFNSSMNGDIAPDHPMKW